MKLFSNISFLSVLALNNIKEYFVERESAVNDIISDNSIYWYGHATTLINLSGTIILTDPVITNRLGISPHVEFRHSCSTFSGVGAVIILASPL